MVDSLAAVAGVGVHAEEELAGQSGFERAEDDRVATARQRLAQEDAATVLELGAADALLRLVQSVLAVVLHLQIATSYNIRVQFMNEFAKRLTRMIVKPIVCFVSLWPRPLFWVSENKHSSSSGSMSNRN